jgi:hypothetical protein
MGLPKGFKHSVETIQRMREVHTGKYHTEKTINKMREVHPHGNKHPNWKGGRYFHSDGYVYNLLPDGKENYIMEHRIIMEHMIGRKLLKGEVVHHIDENKSNNNPLNLILFFNNIAHRKYHNILHKKNEFITMFI